MRRGEEGNDMVKPFQETLLLNKLIKGYLPGKLL